MEEGSLRCDANISRPARRHRRVRAQGRDQEHELGPFAGARARATRPRARSRRSRRASRSCRRPAIGTRTPAPRRRCAPRRRRSTTATSRSRTSLPLEPDDAWIEEIRAAPAGAPAARGGTRYAAELGLKPEVARVLVADRRGEPVRGDRRARRASRPRRRTGSRRTWRGCGTRRVADATTDATVGPQHIADLVALVADGTIAGAGAKQALEEAFRTGADRSRTSSSSEGSGRSPTPASWAPSWTGARGERRRRPRSSAPGTRA